MQIYSEYRNITHNFITKTSIKLRYQNSFFFFCFVPCIINIHREHQLPEKKGVKIKQKFWAKKHVTKLGADIKQNGFRLVLKEKNEMSYICGRLFQTGDQIN